MMRPDNRSSNVITVVATLLLLAGLFFHLISARAIGGSYTAYRDHIVGFVGLTIVAGVIVGGLGWRFWKRRPDISLLILGVTQVIAGYIVYLYRFHVHG
jgi:hypothetical protein